MLINATDLDGKSGGAEWRDLRFFPVLTYPPQPLWLLSPSIETTLNGSVALHIVIPSEVEGSAVLSLPQHSRLLVTMSRRVLVNSNPRKDKALVVEGKRATSAAILRCMLNQGGCGFLQPR